MSDTHVTIQVHVLKPSWINREKNRYRLYIDEYLLTERDWIWDMNTYIDEDIWIDSEPGRAHSLRIEPILQPKSVAQFGLRTLRVNGWPKPDLGGELTELSFTV